MFEKEFHSYKGDSIIILAGKNTKQKSKEDNSVETDLIDNSITKALIPVEGTPLIDLILPQARTIMDEYGLPKTVVVGPSEDLEERLESWNRIDNRIGFTEHGSGRFENGFIGLNSIREDYPSRGLNELFEIIKDNSDDEKFYQLSRRGREVPIEIFCSLAKKAKENGKSANYSMSKQEAEEAIRSAIDSLLEEHKLPARIQRYKVFKTKRLKRRYERYKQKNVEKSLSNMLLECSERCSFKSGELLKDFYNYHINNNIGVYIAASDWPFLLNNFRWITNRVKEKGYPSFFLPLGDEEFICPFHEIDKDYDGPINYRKPHEKIRGWIENPVELEKQSKFANLLYAKPARIPNINLVENVIENRKGNRMLYPFHLFYSLMKSGSNIFFNREGAKGLYTGMHYPMGPNTRFVAAVISSYSATLIKNIFLTRRFVHYNKSLRSSIDKARKGLTKRLTLPYITDNLSMVLGCRMEAEYVPLGTAAIDLDRTKKEKKEGINIEDIYNPIQDHYSEWVKKEVPRAKEVLKRKNDYDTMRLFEKYGIR